MTATTSKSPGKVKNVVLALLALWSIISLVIIVVWATSPDLKGSAQCRAELAENRVKLEGERVVCNDNKVALERLVEEAREEQDNLRAEVLVLLGRLNSTNITLEECRQENAVLRGNITALEEEVERLHVRESNLTAQLELQGEHIEALEHNVTQALHQTESCFSLKDAAQSQMMAAQTQTKACKSNQQYLEKQLQKCKVVESEAPRQTQQGPTPSSFASPALNAIPALMLLCAALHLIT